ncbi:YqiJ family protein [Acidovorax sp. NCPPB 4044]|uniref:YqiJ family protein n=1 Tax=Acidovorax sp. NCPPB 4044 TaxID=2940490 RepID=UPI002303E864|nr:YqiJ family protein [Acidovorax sp. NCPPB 4044]MDA8523581.1 YqiJ family protein [Acidovorax sp. NCPPB 4044]
MGLFSAAETTPFGVAFALIVAIALIEGFGMLVAFSPSNLIDGLIPEVASDTGLDRVLGWLHLGQVPSLVLLVLFLAGYAIFGYALQMVAHAMLGSFLPAWGAGLLALPSGLVMVRGLGSLVAHILPRDETSVVSEMSLVGRTGTISAGTARRGLAAQARVRDAHGRTHYLMAEPDIDGDVFEEGTEILVVRKAGAFYRCIANPHPTLM